MHFAEPQLIHPLLLAATALAVLLVAALGRDRRDLERLGFRNLALSPRAALARRGLVAGLLAAALLACSFGAARLQGKPVPTDLESVGVDVVIALDTSKSMLTRDVKPNRLSAAKDALLGWIGGRRGDRVGLVVFAGEAAVQVPLTLDMDVVGNFIDRMDVDTLEKGGTDIGDALRVALLCFPEDEKDKKRGRAILLVTDGELTDQASRVEPLLAEAKRKGVLVLTVGMGTKRGQPIPDGYSIWGEAQYKQSPSGETVVSRLDEEMLRQIASETGGAYVAGVNPHALASLGETLDRIQKTSLKGKGAMAREELAPAMGAASAGILLLAFLL